MDVSTKNADDRAWVEVNLDQLVANARVIRDIAGGAGLLPMVKANAYGLGAVPCARALESLDPWGFGVATIPEGIELRQAGIRRPIIVFTPARANEQEHYREHDLRAVLDDPDTASNWKLPYHLEVDTGMGRAGVRWDDTARLARFAKLPPEGVFTHLHSADVDPDSVARQLGRFTPLRETFGAAGALIHVANSAGVFRLAGQPAADLFRPGIFLYGGVPGPGLPRPFPVVTVRARVVSARALKAGDTVSYGAEFRASAPTHVATVGFGYADGMRRSVAAGGEVLLRGRRCPVVGRVTMDMTVIETGDLLVAPGEVATIIGHDGDDNVTVGEFARWAGTIPYEVLTGLGPRVPRTYVTDES